MTNIFDSIYSSIVNKNAFLDKIKWYSVLRNLIRITANVVLPIEYVLTQNNRQYQLTPCIKQSGRIIVSLTSFPARINKVWLVIETLLRQTKKPDLIILWLSKEQFSSIHQLPKHLLNLQKRGLRIELREGDLRSHKKYYYTLTEYPDDFLVTVDDDIFYNTKILEYTWKLYEQHTAAVIANYTHNMVFKGNQLQPYSQWQRNVDKGEHLFFGSGGCTLFPPHCMHEDVTNIDLALRLCPTADDIWLNAMVRKQNTKIIPTPHHFEFLPILNRETSHLADVNMLSQNDVQIHNVLNYYHE